MKRHLSFLVIALAPLVVGCQNGAEAAPDKAAADPGQGAKKAPTVKATRVEVAVVNPSRASLSLRLPGEVEAGRDANLSASLGGFVEKVTVEAGDEVRRGQILAMVDTASHGARQAQAKVELDTAKRELKRQKKLGRATPRAQLDAAQSRYDAARAAMQSAAVSVDRSIIKAPFAGVLATVDAEKGETASPGMPLMRLIRLDPIKVSVSLSDRDVTNVKVGMKARISLDARGNLLEGEVKLIKPAADLRTRTFVAEIVVPNADRVLLPGMIANVQLAADREGEDLVIAQDWLVTKPNALGVFVHENGMAAWRPVEIGSVVRDRVIIKTGLKQGEELVITGHRDLADGDPLIIARRGVCCTEGRVVFEGDKPLKKPDAKAKEPAPDAEPKKAAKK